MALDPFLITLHHDSHELRHMADVAIEQGWAVVGRGTDSITLIFSSLSGSKNFPKMEGNLDGGASSSAYHLLNSFGIVAVAGDASAGNIRLSGGSVSECLLRREEHSWFVIKRTSGSKLTKTDSWDRHILESRFIAALETNGNTFFPSSTSRRDSRIFEAKMPFIGAYTLGELLVQGRLSGLTFKEKISSIFHALESLLYCRRSTHSQETYIDKVERRLSLLIERSRIHKNVEAFCRMGSQVNGRDCRPIRELLDTARSEPRCREILSTNDARLCHGDLIPEDILFFPESNRFVLIDPNPQNADPLIDLGKMAMSALIAYDLAIRDWVTCVIDDSVRKPRASVFAQDEWRQLDFEQQEIGHWICKEGRSLVSRDVLPDHRVESRAIMLIAGLQAMAIPVFHALHQGRDDRALYFLAKGHLLTEQAFQEYGI